MEEDNAGASGNAVQGNERDRKLFLGGLNYATTEDNLRAYFCQWGKLVDVVVMRFPDTKRSRGFGFITYETKDEADACFEARPHTVDEANVETKRATPREKDRGGSAHGADGGAGGSQAEFGSLVAHKKIFVGGLDYSTTDDTLRDYFTQFGEIVDCIVMKFRDTKRSRGFGFVTFSNVEAVDAVQQARPHTLDGAKVETKRATPRDSSGGDASGGAGPGGMSNVKKVFLGGLKDAHTDDALREYFSQFGSIRQLEQLMDKSTNRKRGFGFVEFDDYDPVDKLMLQPGHKVANYRLDVKRAVSKEEMRGGGANKGPGGHHGGGGGGAGGRFDGNYAPWAGPRGGGGGDHHQHGGRGGYGSGNGPFGGGGGSGDAWGNQGSGYGFNSAFGGGRGGNAGSASGNPNPWGGASWEDQGGWGYGSNGSGGGNSAGFGGGYGRSGGGAMRNQMQNRSAPYNIGGGGAGGGNGGGGRGFGGGAGRGGGGAEW